MHKKDLSETDIRTKFITPAIVNAGWDLHTQIREEVALTAGRITVEGSRHKRGPAKFADYILYYKPNLPIAVIEAKDNDHALGDGMQQALGYGDMHGGLPFVFSSNGVFNPYTGIKTNLLFFEKGRPTGAVWYFEHPYPEGYKFYSKTKPIRIEEFEREKAWWGGAGREGREENEQAWRVTLEQIQAANYNLDSKNPHSVEQGPGDPDELLAEYRALQGEVDEIRNRLKGELAAALEHHG